MTETTRPAVQSVTEQALWTKIETSYRASYQYKEQLGLPNLWQTCEAYWAGDVNASESEEDPGSETNVILPIIESQVSDLVDGAMDFSIKGMEPTDSPYTDKVRHVLKWAWYMNKMVPKLDMFERERLNYGTSGFRVGYDPDACAGKGMPTIDYVGVEEMFPDPKVKDFRHINDGDFFIRTIPYNNRALIRRFGDIARSVQTGGSASYDPRIFKDQDDGAGVDEILRAQCLLYEYWEIDEDDKLRRVYAAGGIILEDSADKKNEDGTHDDFYSHGKYPYVLIPCYKKKGRLWGIGDTELLIPTQDVINDLDDQIRMNARTMGNIQIVVGTAAGINLKKWTNLPGLKIPAKDPLAWKQVVPYPMPAYVSQRRLQGFTETEIISGRSDVTEGRRSGSLRSAAAIAQMQDAGNRRAKHKKLMLQEGLREAMDLVYEYICEFMDVERAFDFEEGNKRESMWFKGSDFKEIPIQTLNEGFDPSSDEEGTGEYKDLMRADGEGPMTRKGEFMIEVDFGAGLPNSPSFIYESTLELHRENLITQEEARATLKTVLNYPIVDPYKPQGKFLGRNNSAEQLAMANGQPIPGQEGQPIPGQQQMDLSGQAPQMDPIDMLMQAIELLPPEILQQVLGQAMGGQAMPGQMPGQGGGQVDPAMLQQLQALMGGGM